MRTLVIDTSTAHLSLALFDGDAPLVADHRLLGRGHAEALMPAIAALPDGGRAERLLVALGPGSFTGIRVGLAAARALAFAWDAQCYGYGTLELVAACARSSARCPADAPLAVAMDGGHGEWFVSAVEGAPPQSLTPDAAAGTVAAHHVAGARAADLVALRGWGEAVGGEARAAGALLLRPDQLLTDLEPMYGRAPDAKPTSAPVAS